MIFGNDFALTLFQLGFWGAYNALGYLNAGVILTLAGYFLMKPSFERLIACIAVLGICYFVNVLVGGLF